MRILCPSLFRPFCGALLCLCSITVPYPVISYAFAQTTADADKTEDLAAQTPLFSEEDILAYLENILSWQREAHGKQASQTSARETLLADALHHYADQSLTATFDFARTQATFLSTVSTTAETEAKHESDDIRNSASASTTIQDMTRRTDRLVATLESELQDINRQLPRMAAAKRTLWEGQRNKLKSEINLAKAQQDLLRSIQKTMTEPEESEKASLLYKINNLARSSGFTTSADNASARTAEKALPAETVDPAAIEPEQNVPQTGLLALTGSIFDMMRQKTSVTSLRQQTRELRDQAKEMRNTVRDSLKRMVLSGHQLGTDFKQDAASLARQSADIDALTAQFRTLSASVIPLGHIITNLENSARVLKEWQSLLDMRLAQAIQKLIVRLVLLGLMLMIPFALSEILKRMTNRYVQDKRIQRQLRLLRRFGLLAVLVLIILFNLTTEIGSLATFIGFLTAGLAVALQNVLLSLVAHFFYFGRYGIRTGDRVTVGGVTGDVTQIGMVRLYLAEVSTEGDDAEPTGRIVTFPNAILFQNQAFYKHMRQ